MIITATPETANRIVERYRDAGAIRILAPGESIPEHLHDVASPVLGMGRVREQQNRLIERIREATEQLERWDRTAAIWESLRGMRCICHGHGSTVEPSTIHNNHERAKAELELSKLRLELAELTPLVAAKTTTNVFSKAFWKATFQGDLVRRVQDLESRIREAEHMIKSCDDTPLPVRCPAGIPGEFDRLCQELIDAGLTPPSMPTEEAIATAKGIADGNRQELEANLNFARQTLADLESNPEEAAVHYSSRATILVGPALAKCDPVIERWTFDRRILEGAESVTETDWEVLTSTQDRSIILGDFSSRPEDSTTPALEAWRNEHRPQWLRESGRLVVLLAPQAVECRRELLEDRPEYELRFGTTPNGEFVLAAVAFPLNESVADAKAFLASELDEVQLVPLGPLRWNADELLAAWPWLEADDGVWIDIQPGVKERVVSVDGLPATAAVRFDSSIWTANQAEEWIERMSRTARSRRTCDLTVADPARSNPT